LPDAALLLITNGELYGPRPQGRASILIAAGRIIAVGEISKRTVDALGVEVDVIDAAGCVVTPGLIDPHEHLIGGSGESGFHSQTPEIYLHELLQGGITTVVGCLGVDTSSRTMPALLAKCKGVRAEGLSAHIYTGGYTVPAVTITGDARDDILFIEEVIGIGETAIADHRGSRATLAELARLASRAYTGGILAGKAGVLHLHTGDDERRLADVRALIDDFGIAPETLYPTHVERNEQLFDEALALTGRGVTVDIDVMEGDLAMWLRRYRERGGAEGRLTASSDAAITSPASLLEQVRDCVVAHGFTLEDVLPLVTSNTARMLKLVSKGRLEPGADGDVLALETGTLRLRHVVAAGRVMLRDGVVTAREKFLEKSKRRINLNAAS